VEGTFFLGLDVKDGDAAEDDEYNFFICMKLMNGTVILSFILVLILIPLLCKTRVEKFTSNSFNQAMNEILNQPVHQRNTLKSKCADKLYVKEYAFNILKEKCTPTTLAVADNVSDLMKFVLPNIFVLKANNDSGGTQIIKPGIKPDVSKIERYKYKPYGKDTGEWFYFDIKYKCFAEEYIGDNMTDYKFHCSNGIPKCCQVIRDRGIDTNEVIVDMNGNVLNIHFDEHFRNVKTFNKPQNWTKMIDWASRLSKDFDYVRVDLYTVKKNVFVGELTFTPLAGNYKGNGQVELGKLLFP